MIYKRCPHCGERVAVGKKCGCGFKREYAAPQGTRKLYHTSRWNKLQKTIVAFTTVSYTHLDVYKRQRYEGSENAPLDQNQFINFSKDGRITGVRDIAVVRYLMETMCMFVMGLSLIHICNRHHLKQETTRAKLCARGRMMKLPNGSGCLLSGSGGNSK